MYNVGQLITQVRNTLTDFDKDYWDDSELLEYYNEAIRVLSADRKGREEVSIVPLVSSEKSYLLNGVIRFIKISDDAGNNRPLILEDSSEDDLAIRVVNNNEIFVFNPGIGTNLNITHTALPDIANMNDRVNSGDEVAIRYYILARSYEKEDDAESFAKSDKFLRRFEIELKKVSGNSSLPAIDHSYITTKSYFY